MKQLFNYNKDYGGVQRTTIYEILDDQYQENTVSKIREYLGSLTELLVDRGIISHGDVLRMLPINQHDTIHVFDGIPFYGVTGGLRGNGYAVTQTVVTDNPKNVWEPDVTISTLGTECDLQWGDAEDEAYRLNKEIKD